ncbi:MAG TPA: hypothetical protein VFL90_10845 [Methylomirabilota bacterium]|nr:hypothetical protein [Methylomirabilota bacterium]
MKKRATKRDETQATKDLPARNDENVKGGGVKDHSIAPLNGM